MKKIITHDGFFHADEVFAIALLHQVLGVCPVERRRNISQEEFNDPDIWILDVGGRYNPHYNNFDHHQDPALESTNVLVLQELLKRRIIDTHTDESLHNELIGEFSAISEIDRNGYAQTNGFQVNSLIRAYNNIPGGFFYAIEVAIRYIDAVTDTVKKTYTSREIWNKAHVFPTIARVCTEYPVHWKRYKQEPFLVYPEGDTWKLVSIDSEKYPIVGTGNETFLHNAKFLAVYPTRNEAIHAALKSILEIDKVPVQ